MLIVVVCQILCNWALLVENERLERGLEECEKEIKEISNIVNNNF